MSLTGKISLSLAGSVFRSLPLALAVAWGLTRTTQVVFIALHWMQGGLVRRKLSVCLSVRLSNAWIVTKRNKVLFRFCIPYERTFSLVLWEKGWLVGTITSTWDFGSSWPRWSENADIQSIFAPSASVVAPSKKLN